MGGKIIGSYSFEVEYKDQTVKSPALKIIDGIRLFPMRFGLYLKSSSGRPNTYPSDHFRALDGRDRSIPIMEDFGYLLNPMILRDGWIYVYSNETKSVYVYECYNCTYTLAEIKKTANSPSKDPMQQQLNKTLEYILLGSQDMVRIFYTSIKLSDIFIESNYKEDPRKDGLGSVFNCKDWSDGTTESDVLRRCVDVDDIWFMTDSSFALDLCEANEQSYQFKSQIDEAVTLHREKKTKYRDLFFVLDDPLSCAEKLVIDLNDARLEHEALIRSIRTGVSPSEIKNLLLNFQSSSQSETGMLSDMDLFKAYPEKDRQQIEQAQYIHLLLSYLYNFIYSEKENHLKKGERALNKDAIEQLLATQERKDSREKIDNIRKAIVKYINSPIFTRFCEQFSVKTADIASSKREVEHSEMKAFVQKGVMNILTAIAPVPHINDKGLDLEHIYNDYKDPCKETIEAILTAFISGEGNKIGILLGGIPSLAGLNLDIAEDRSMTSPEKVSPGVDKSVLEYLIAFNSLINFAWEWAFRTKQIKLFIEKFTIDNKNLFIQFDKGDVTTALNKLGRVRQDPCIIEGRGFIQVKVNKISDLNKPVVINTAPKTTPKYAKFFKRLAENEIYLSILSFVQLGSTLNSLKETDWKSNTRLQNKFKSVELTTSIVAVQRQFALVSLKLRQVPLSQAAVKAASMEIIQKQLARLTGVGAVAAAVNTYIDGRLLWDQNDRDAAVFYYTASAIGGLGGFFLLAKSIFAWGWLGPAAAIAAAVSFVCLFVAEWLKDTEIEIFIKRTVLYEDIMEKLSGKPYEIMNKLSSQEMRMGIFNDELYDKPENIHMKVLNDYKFQLEDFFYTQMMFPFFSTEIKFIQGQYLRAYGSSTPVPAYKHVQLLINSGIAGISAGLVEIELTAKFVKRKKPFGTNETFPIVFRQSTSRSDSFDPMYQFTNRMLMTEYDYEYMFCDVDPDYYFFSSRNLYLVLLIRFKHIDGSLTPMARDGRDTFLVYRYKIDIPDDPYSRGILLYHKAKTLLEKVYISPVDQKGDEAYEF